jgi:hypothetical protein
LCIQNPSSPIISETDPKLNRIRKEFLDPNSQKNMSRLNADLSDIQLIMKNNIQEVLQRGEKLESACFIVSCTPCAFSVFLTGRRLCTESLLRPQVSKTCQPICCPSRKNSRARQNTLISWYAFAQSKALHAGNSTSSDFMMRAL